MIYWQNKVKRGKPFGARQEKVTPLGKKERKKEKKNQEHMAIELS